MLLNFGKCKCLLPTVPLLFQCLYCFSATTVSVPLLFQCHYCFSATTVSVPLLFQCHYVTMPHPVIHNHNTNILLFTDIVNTEPTYEAVGSLQRTQYAGLVKIDNWTPDLDLIALYPFPPAKVRDLRYMSMSYEDKTVTLQWTAVGDNLDEQTGKHEQQHQRNCDVIVIYYKMKNKKRTKYSRCSRVQTNLTY